MSKPFDQREALGVLESFGKGNFQELMDVEITTWRLFTSLALPYVSFRSQKKFSNKMKEVFDKEGK